ncbi:MAG TPA: hypothetical protein VFB25_02505 [Gaiellaceae bacterium]|nr:hypothetical protein [Gaiellaceae bacterium]
MRLLKKLLLVLTPMGAAAFVAGGGTFSSFRDLARWTPAAKTAEAKSDPLWKTKKLLIGVMLIGAAVYLGVGGGTFANFQAETSNNGSSIASGTLTLTNTVNGANACFSYSALSADNANANCTAGFATTNVTPGVIQSSQVAEISVTNSGSINGSKLYLYASQINGKLTTQLDSGHAVSSLAVAGGMEGTVSNTDSITVSYQGKSQVFTVNGTPTGMPTNSNGGATSIPVTTQNANFTYPIGATVTDTSGNTATTNTDCFDTKTATGSSFTFNPITSSTYQQAYNPLCGAVLMWVQEVTNGVAYCWFGAGSTKSTYNSGAESSTGVCKAPVYGTTSGLSGNGVTSIPISNSGGFAGIVSTNDTITVTQGANTQTFTASGPTAVGATSIPINSANVGTAFTSGAVVTDTTVDAAALPALDANARTDTITNFDTSVSLNNGKMQLWPITAGSPPTQDQSGTRAELSAGSTRNFYVGLYLPNPGGANQNAVQGLASTFGLTWHMDQ